MSIFGIALPPRPTCGVDLDLKFSKGLYRVALQTNELLVALINELLRKATPTVDESLRKRLFLYEGVLLNHATEAATICATHRLSFPMMTMLRSSHEYVARTYYFSDPANQGALKAQFQSIWPKLDNILGRSATSRQVLATIRGNVAAFRNAYPNWMRPSDPQTKRLVQAVVPTKRFQKIYDTYYVIPSMVIHGFFEWVPAIIYHDGNTTQLHDFERFKTMESAVCHVLRVVFAFMSRAAREFALTASLRSQSMNLFSEYYKEKTSLRISVLSPFPVS